MSRVRQTARRIEPVRFGCGLPRAPSSSQTRQLALIGELAEALEAHAFERAEQRGGLR